MRFVFILFICFISFSANIIAQGLIINEIMYNNGINDLEYVEIYNNSASTVDVQGWYIIDNNDAHTPCLLSGTIAPYNFFIVTSSRTLFQIEYPSVTSININDYGLNWAFGNGGDVVRLYNNTQVLQDEVAYEDGGLWPSSADGKGPSLELLHPGLNNNLATSWDPSSTIGGSPGAQNTVYTLNVSPTCKDGQRSVDLPSNTDIVKISVTAFDYEGLEKVELFVNTGSGYNMQLMHDDGTNGDEFSGDSTYTSLIPAQSTASLVKYYALATDLIGQEDSWPNNAPQEYHAYTVGYQPPNLQITEVLAVNNAINTDGAGEYDDWFEIQNQGDAAVNLGGMFVSNSLGSSRGFELPDLNLDPGAFLLIWADDDLGQGSLHVDFKLSSSGESVALFDAVDKGNVLISGWKFGLMSADISMGFLSEESTAPEYISTPTPGSSNTGSTLFSDVCINEFQTTSNFGGIDDWVEIYNRGVAPFDLSGCYLSDDIADNIKWAFPQGTIIQPQEYLVIYEDALQFGFSSTGDEIIMFTAPDGITGLDFYDFGEQIPDQSEGRKNDGSSIWTHFTEPTVGTANSYTLAMEEIPEELITQFHLFQNYPNPFNPKTTIFFNLASALEVHLNVYNSQGKKVISLLNQNMQSGLQSVEWNGKDDKGRQIASGVYFYRIEAGSFRQIRKMILLK